MAVNIFFGNGELQGGNHSGLLRYFSGIAILMFFFIMPTILTLVRPIICYCSAAVNQLSGEIFLELQTFTKIEITQLLTNQFK